MRVASKDLSTAVKEDKKFEKMEEKFLNERLLEENQEENDKNYGINFSSVQIFHINFLHAY